ncbi:MAG: phosphoribosyltransferase family protein [Bacteroidetes bacterium]|nr:phosphoribosyltransferase family protein [Bacteroidota bacterium]
MNLLQETWNVLYPLRCKSCQSPLIHAERVLCLRCRAGLDLVFGGRGFQTIEQLFWGRVRVDEAYSLLRFSNKSMTQRLIHLLKYDGDADVGLLLGEMLGRRLLSVIPQGHWVLVPVPIHPKKKRVRGYNQSEVLARGMVKHLDAHIDEKALIRKEKGKSLTTMNRIERAVYTDQLFDLHPECSLEGQSVILIDDVLTTGATLCSCARLLREAKVNELIIATAAFTDD